MATVTKEQVVVLTVGELITLLSAHPPDSPVGICTAWGPEPEGITAVSGPQYLWVDMRRTYASGVTRTVREKVQGVVLE